MAWTISVCDSFPWCRRTLEIFISRVFTAWNDIMTYYIQAFKTGIYPDVHRDRIFMWARLWPARAEASDDAVARPTRWQDVCLDPTCRFHTHSPIRTDRRRSVGHCIRHRSFEGDAQVQHNACRDLGAHWRVEPEALPRYAGSDYRINGSVLGFRGWKEDNHRLLAQRIRV